MPNLRSSNLLFLAALPLCGAFDASVTWKNTSGSTATNQPFLIQRPFFPGEMPSDRWPQPYVNGVAATTWQAHHVRYYRSGWCTADTQNSAVCPGSVHFAVMAFTATVTDGTTITITFRPAAIACSGNGSNNVSEAQCATQGLNTAGALAYGGADWDFIVEANAVGTATHSQSIRAMFTAGDVCQRYAGPVWTSFDAGYTTGSGHNCAPITTRPYNFGFIPKKELIPTATFSGTTIPIHENSWIAGATPQTIITLAGFSPSQTLTVSSATSTSLTLSSAALLEIQSPLFAVDGAVTLNGTCTFGAASCAVSDATSFAAGDYVWIGDSIVYVFSKTGNTLNFGSPQGAASNRWGAYYTRQGGTIPSGAPVRKYADEEWLLASGDSGKSISHRAYVDFWNGRNGPAAFLTLRNNWTDRSQAIMIDVFRVKLGVGGGTTAVTRNKVGMGINSKLVYPDGPEQGRRDTYLYRGQVWESETPNAGVYWYNLAHLSATRALPQDPLAHFDDASATYHFSTPEVSSYGIDTPGWDNSTKGSISVETWGDSIQKAYYDGQCLWDEGNGGSSKCIGEIPTPVAAGLYLSDRPALTDWARADELIFGHGPMATTFPIYPVSTVNTGTFCGGTANFATTAEPGAPCTTAGFNTVTPFGKPMSPLHEPNFGVSQQMELTRPIVGRRGQRSWAHGISFGASHAYNLPWVPALLTGHPFWTDTQMEMTYGYMLMGYLPAPYNAGANAGTRRIMTADKPYPYPSSGPRGIYITVRLMAMTIPILPNSPQREAMESLYKMNVALLEGENGFTAGNFYIPCSGGDYRYSRWCFGYFRLGNNNATMTGVPLIGDFSGCAIIAGANPARAFKDVGAFQFSYPTLAARIGYGLGLHEMKPLGLHIHRAYANTLMNSSAHIAANTGYALAKAYGWASSTLQPEGSNTDCTGQDYNTLGAAQPQFQNWGNWFKASPTSMHDPNLLLTDPIFYPNLARDKQYNFEAAGGMIGMVGDWDARRVWNTSRRINIPTNGPTINGLMPNYSWSPDWWHKIWEVTITPGTTSATMTFTRPEKATTCSYAFSTSTITDPSDSADTSAGTVGRLRHSFTVSGLTTATTYNLRTTCKDSDTGYVGRRYDRFTTN